MTPRILHWGIYGAGRISDDFVSALTTLPAGSHEVKAVGARSLENAMKFAQRHHVPRFYGDYESLLGDADIDVIYIGTVNCAHENAVLSALDAGKHVLCEKPLGVNAKAVSRMVNKAREKGLFLMEAYWTRFFPALAKLREEIQAGVIGDVKVVSADFGFILTGNVLLREYAGGATTGLGCYLPMLSNYVFFSNSNVEMPEKIVANGCLNKNGVDTTATVSMHYSNNRVANFVYTVDVETVNEAFIAGTKGVIKMPERFWCPSKITTPSGTYDYPLPTTDQSFHFPGSVGLCYEAEHVRQCLLKGYHESPIMPLDESLMLAKINDEIRRQLGVRFLEDED